MKRLMRVLATLVVLSPASGWAEVRTLHILPDTSGSLDDREFGLVMERITTAIPKIVTALDVQEVVLQPWATSRDVWSLPAAEVRLPRREIVEAVASQPTEAERLFSVARQKRERDLARDSARRRSDADRVNLEAVAEALAPIQIKLRALRQGKSPCTAVRDVLERASREPTSSLLLVVTDGEGGCALDGAPVLPLPSGATTVVVLVPVGGNADAVGQKLDEQRRRILDVAPWALVVPSCLLTGGAEDWLMPLLSNRRPPGASAASGTR